MKALDAPQAVSRHAAFLVGSGAAFLAAWPAALRVTEGLKVPAFFVLSAGAALLMAPLSAALAASESRSRFSRSVTVGALLAAAALLPFATLLKVSTHHRPLGGVTFAVVAGLVILGLSLVCVRLITWAGEQVPTRLRAAARAAVVGLSALGAAAVLIALVAGLKSDSLYRAGFFDALRALLLSTAAAYVPVPRPILRWGRWLGLAVWLSVVTVGVCLGHAPAMQTELAARCPVLHWPLTCLGG